MRTTEIYTDVDGVYTADPRIIPNAKKLDEITYDEMLDLATLGAQVLHNRSVGLAKKYDVPLVVRSSLTDAEGTVVKGENKVEKRLISGVAVDNNPARIALMGVPDEPGIAFKIFNILANDGISVDIILQSVGRDGTKDISFTVDENNLQEALRVLEANSKKLPTDHIETEEHIAKVSVVGAGMMTDPGVAAKMFGALYDNSINIKMISTSENRITVIVDEEDAKVAARAVHDAFIPEND